MDELNAEVNTLRKQLMKAMKDAATVSKPTGTATKWVPVLG